MRTRFHGRTDLVVDGFIAAILTAIGTWWAMGLPGAWLVSLWVVATVGFISAFSMIRVARALYGKRHYLFDLVMGFRVAGDVVPDEFDRPASAASPKPDAWDMLRADTDRLHCGRSR